MASWISIADIQSWIPAANNATATELAMIVTGLVQQELEQDFAIADWTETYDTRGVPYVLLRHWPVRSITSITYNGRALAPAAYQVPGYAIDPVVSRKLNFSGLSIARGVMNLTIAYRAGYDFAQAAGSATGAPSWLWQAMRIIAQAIFNAAAADPNLVSENTGGVFSGSFVASGVGSIPPAAREWLAKGSAVAP